MTEWRPLNRPHYWGEPSLNDTCRFWFAISSNPDVIDDPKGFDHPLFDFARRIGISPGRLHDACRHFQELRAEKLDQSSEDGGIGGGLDLQGLNSAQQNNVLGQGNLQSARSYNQVLPNQSQGVESGPFNREYEMERLRRIEDARKASQEAI